MHAQSLEGVAPAMRKVREATARRVLDLLLAEGAPLETLLRGAGALAAVPGTERVETHLPVIQALFCDLCVVMIGSFPQLYWATRSRHDAEPEQVPICTCKHFSLRGDCEHVQFVRGLLGRSQLQSLPLEKPKGRPRATSRGAPRLAKRARRGSHG